jgi:methionyl aminopeptidase
MGPAIPIKTSDELILMRASCTATRQVLDEVARVIVPGATTLDIDNFVHRRITELGGVPSTLNYKGYPKSCCTSLNDVICHGIPNAFETLKAGDIINVDVTTYKGGFHGDSSRMYFVGGEDACTEEARELVAVTKKALMVGIGEVAPGKKIGDIGAAIQEYIRTVGKNYGIVREYTGHGVGRDFHEAPQVIHVGRRGHGETMKPGMTFTIEPMINEGSFRTVLSKIDGWTVRTADGKLSAQWEHTVLVTELGVEILT